MNHAPGITYETFSNMQSIQREKKNIHRLYLEQIVKHFRKPLTRNIDFQDIRTR